MSDESPVKRGEAAWKQEREDVARRNADAHKRADVRRRSRASIAEVRSREDAQREVEQLRALNAQLSKQQAR
jgi:hypothetical protein